MIELLSPILKRLGWDYWVKIETDEPRCTYYFGPFDDRNEAQDASTGYIEDLKDEEAAGIQLSIGRMPTPTELTIFDDDLGGADGRRTFPTLSGQWS